jgi:hypothetical protein
MNVDMSSIPNIIDRESRQNLSALIRRYLNSEITAFQFDEELFSFPDSKDHTIHDVISSLWYFYDDCIDHHVHLDKPSWDFHQRLLLLLDSDSIIVKSSYRKWQWTQLIAVVALLASLSLILYYGWGKHLLVLWMPFGIVAWAIHKLNQLDEPIKIDLFNTYPFPNVSVLRRAYEQCQFSKQHHPKQIETNRPVRSESYIWFHKIFGSIIIAMISPLILLLQCFPGRVTLTTVKHIDNKLSLQH